MPRKKKSKKHNWRLHERTPDSKNASHVRFSNDMMDSAAWAQLSVHAIVLFLYIKKKYNGRNDDDLSMTTAEAEKLMTKRVFYKSIDQLIEFGFIYIVRRQWEIRKPIIYGLSHQWQLYGTPHFEVKKRNQIE